MKKLGIIAFVFLSQITNAQVSRNLGDFDEVKVFDKITVKLISSSENKVVITGDRADEVETVNKNGELKNLFSNSFQFSIYKTFKNTRSKGS